jgi:hypothetical protein
MAYRLWALALGAWRPPCVTRGVDGLAAAMQGEGMMQTLIFATVWPALFVAHQLGDMWIQSDHQAVAKGEAGVAGARACLGHVASYTGATAVFVGGVWLLCKVAIDLVAFACGQVISAVTHYVADRRTPLRRVARWLGKDSMIRRLAVLRGTGDQPKDVGPGTGAHELDQSWHYLWLFVAALVTASAAVAAVVVAAGVVALAAVVMKAPARGSASNAGDRSGYEAGGTRTGCTGLPRAMPCSGSPSAARSRPRPAPGWPATPTSGGGLSG